MSVPTTVVAGKLTPTGIGAFVDQVPPHAPLGLGPGGVGVGPGGVGDGPGGVGPGGGATHFVGSDAPQSRHEHAPNGAPWHVPVHGYALPLKLQ